MRISDWSSDVCSSDLSYDPDDCKPVSGNNRRAVCRWTGGHIRSGRARWRRPHHGAGHCPVYGYGARHFGRVAFNQRSEEHTSELQSLMRISYAVFCLKKKNNKTESTYSDRTTIITHQIHKLHS